MGQLVSETIDGLYQGVSRQPDKVRLRGQVEEADNALLSVVTGGFERRMGTALVSILDNFPNTDTLFFHAIIRDATERYLVLVADGDLYVYSLVDGSQKTVNAITDDAQTYLETTPADNLAMVTIADYTVVANKNVTVAMGDAGSSTITGSVVNFTDLANPGTTGDIYRVTGAATTLDDYYVTWDSTTTSWIECADPTIANTFDLTTMPHLLVREADGTFTFKQGTWKARTVGDATVVPNPDFVGKTVGDIAFHRNRLAVSGDEIVFFTADGDYFNFWPSKSTEDLDTDPFGKQASGNQVNILRFLQSFQKSLFATSDNVQFEISGDTLTAGKSAIDQSTAYSTSGLCRPVVLGDELYFAAAAERDAVILEYYYNFDTVTNIASDISKHCKGYIPAHPIVMTGDTVTGTMFVLTDADRSLLYAYRFYWTDENGTRTKAQSSWSKWSFGDDAYIVGAKCVGSTLYLVIRRGDDSTYLEKLSLADEVTDVDLTTYNVRLDRRTSLTGTYDADTNKTTWTVPYSHDDDLVLLLADDFSTTLYGRSLLLAYPTDTTITATGDFSAGSVIVGKTYRRKVTFSKQYPRDGNGKSLTSGRCQMKYIEFDYAKGSGPFDIVITPDKRDAETHTFTGRIVGSVLVGDPGITDASGTFKVPVGSRADTVTISVDDTYYHPSTIVSAHWVGFYNEVVRQEHGA